LAQCDNQFYVLGLKCEIEGVEADVAAAPRLQFGMLVSVVLDLSYNDELAFCTEDLH
jgi:hypothetical protein